MADQLEEIKRKIDIVELINEFLPLKKTGRNFKTLCPFHSETAPSFIVSPERQIFKCFGCFPVGTKIKTPKGLHSIDQIKKHDLVISGKGEPKKVIFAHKRSYRGKIVKVLLWKLGGAVSLTEDHKVFIIDGASYTQQYKNFSRRFRKYERLDRERYLQKLQRYFPIKKIPADDLKIGDRLLYPIDRKEEDLKEVDLKKFITKTLPPHGKRPRKIPYKISVEKDFLALLGYWIAEGSSHRAYIRFSLGFHEEKFARDIQKLIKRLFGLETTVHRRKGAKTGLELTCCHSFLANIFENLCGKGADNKRIPFIFQHLPPKKQKVILEAVLRGDGHTHRFSKSPNPFLVITTTSPILAEQLRDIILRLGFFPTEQVAESKVDRNGVSHKKAYIIMWSKVARPRYRLIYKTPDGTEYWILPVRKLEKQLFKGSVYNLTLESDHSYIARNFMVANCGETGDIYGFLMKMEGLEFGEALRTLAKRAGVKLRRYRPSEAEKQKSLLYEINHLASEFYHYLLTFHRVGKQALQYIKARRGINDKTLRLFKLGFAPAMWDGLQKFLVGKKSYKVEDLEKAGLIIKSEKRRGYYDRFRARIMFPLEDHRGNVAGFAGRTLDPKQTEAKYINTPETPIYHKSDLLYGLRQTREAIKKANFAIVVEGELDVLSSYQVGVQNVVAIKGSALTESQASLLKRFTENLVLALDRDIAGDQAARRGIEIADQAGMAIKVVKLRGGKDPDEVAQKDSRLWKKLVKEALPIYDYFLDSAFSRFSVKTVEGKRSIGRELVPVLGKISDEIVRSHYVGQLAEKLGVNEEAILAQIEKFLAQEKPEPALEKPEEPTEKPSRREVLEEHLLALAFQTKNWALLGKRKPLSLVKTARFGRILETLGNYLKKYKTLESGRLAKMLPAELAPVFDKLFLLDLGNIIENEELVKKELAKTLSELEKLAHREKLREISSQIKALEKEKGTGREAKAKLKRLNEKFRDLSAKLAASEPKK